MGSSTHANTYLAATQQLCENGEQLAILGHDQVLYTSTEALSQLSRCGNGQYALVNWLTGCHGAAWFSRDNPVSDAHYHCAAAASTCMLAQAREQHGTVSASLS